MKSASDRLREARIKAGYETAASAARRFGWHVSTYRSHENGQTQPPRDAIIQYAAAFQVPVASLLEDVRSGWAPVRTVPIRGDVAAGHWLEYDEALHDEEPAQIPAVPTRYANLDQFAYRIRGPSMDRKRIVDGDFVVCVPFWEARSSPLDGDVVIVERRSGRLIERTCKQVEVRNGQIKLCPRSSDPRFQEPLPYVSDSHDHVEIVGLVIGRYSPI